MDSFSFPFIVYIVNNTFHFEMYKLFNSDGRDP